MQNILFSLYNVILLEVFTSLLEAKQIDLVYYVKGFLSYDKLIIDKFTSIFFIFKIFLKINIILY